MVIDVIILLGSLIGVDEKDVVIYKSDGRVYWDYIFYFDVNGLNGVKIGVFNDVLKDYYENGEYDEILFKEMI